MKCELTSIERICKKIYSGGTPKSNINAYYEGGTIPWLNTKEISFNRIRKTERFITQVGLDNSSAKWVESPAVVVAMYGATAGNVATVHIPLTTNQACCNLIIDEKKADFRYVYYYLKWKYKELSGLANGGAQQNLNAKLIKEFPIYLPDIIAQRKIANILWNIDDKIENNIKTSKNVEEQARVIFHQWKESNKHREFLRLADVAIINSDTYSPKENWEYVNYLDTSNITSGVIGNIDYIQPQIEKLPSRARRKIKKNDIVYSTVRPNQLHYGIVSDPLPNMLVSTGFSVIRSNLDEVCNELIYICITESDFTKKMQQLAEQSTSAFPSIRPTDLGTCLIPVPISEDVDFTNLLKSFFCVISSNLAENRKLAFLRDVLLPRLISGEISVSSIEI